MLTTVVLLVGADPRLSSPPRNRPGAAAGPAAQPPRRPRRPAPPSHPAQAAPSAAPVRRARRRGPSITVLVTDRQGQPLPDVTVKATGPMEREGQDRRRGHGACCATSPPAPTGCGSRAPATVTFEREVMVAAGRPVKTTAELTAAPPPPPPPRAGAAAGAGRPPPPPVPPVRAAQLGGHSRRSTRRTRSAAARRRRTRRSAAPARRPRR